MKNLNIILFSLASLLTSTTWAHADIVWKYPLHVQCEQTDNKQNGWTTRHLFSFEQEGNPVFSEDGGVQDGAHGMNVVGKYKSHVYIILPNETKEFRSEKVEGPASFKPSNLHDYYGFSALGFLAPEFDEKTGIPQVAVGAEVFIDHPTKKSKVDFLKKGSGRLGPLKHAAKCRVITAAEAAKFDLIP